VRTIVIGDVHGCADELDELLMSLELQASDRLVFLGDLMDRGPYPARCVRRVRLLGAECTASNHDEKHVRYRRHELIRKATGKKNPVKFDAVRAEENAMLSDDDIAWIAALPMSIDLGTGWHAVHAGLEPCKTFAEQKDSSALLRTRFINEDGTAYSAKDPYAPDPTDKWFWTERWHGPESIVYGHHIHRFLGPRIDSHEYGAFGSGTRATCVGIDTGCYAGGRLTAMILLPTGEYWFEHVDAKRVYEPLSDKYGADKPEPLMRTRQNDAH
jgi:bis(5'-nucleosyl)-tetraphosphatase (symmetrical)